MIVRGLASADGQFNQVCALRRNPAGLAGTGVVIGPRHVLTAKHVAAGGLTEARFPTSNFTETPVTARHRVDHVVAHPDAQVDLCVVVLKDPAPASFRAARVGDQADFARAQQNGGVMVGFGPNTEEETLGGSGIKRHSPTLVISPKPAPGLDAHLRFRVVPGPQAICTTDSGGPFLLAGAAEETVIGIAIERDILSSPHPCGRDSIYLRVDLFREWINRQVAAA